MSGRMEEMRMGKVARRFLDSILFSRSAQFRIGGTLIGLLSMILPWGSIIVRDDLTHATVSLTSVWFADLVTSAVIPVSIASLLFAAATIAALLDARAVIAQIPALAVLFATVPGLLGDIAVALGPTLPDGSVSTSIAAGFYLGVFSAIVLLVSFIPFKEVGNQAKTGLIGSERLRPEENPYHAGNDRPRFP